MLSPRNGMEVIGEAADGREAVRLAHELIPDVIIMDLLMPNVDGIEATREIKTQMPDARILILTSFEEQEQAKDVMAAGASGYILKDSGADELIQAIRTVYSGKVILTPQMMQTLTNPARDPQAAAPAAKDLTARELQVLEGIVEGLTNRQIALRLGIRPTTVRSHVSAILAKLDVENRTQAAMAAQEYKLL